MRRDGVAFSLQSLPCAAPSSGDARAARQQTLPVDASTGMDASDRTTVDSSSTSGEAGSNLDAAKPNDGAGTGVPSGPCAPLSPLPVTLGTILGVGEDLQSIYYLADDAPDSGQDRVFVSNGNTLYRKNAIGSGQSGSPPNADWRGTLADDPADADPDLVVWVFVHLSGTSSRALRIPAQAEFSPFLIFWSPSRSSTTKSRHSADSFVNPSSTSRAQAGGTPESSATASAMARLEASRGIASIAHASQARPHLRPLSTRMRVAPSQMATVVRCGRTRSRARTANSARSKRSSLSSAAARSCSGEMSRTFLECGIRSTTGAGQSIPLSVRRGGAVPVRLDHIALLRAASLAWCPLAFIRAPNEPLRAITVTIQLCGSPRPPSRSQSSQRHAWWRATGSGPQQGQVTVRTARLAKELSRRLRAARSRGRRGPLRIDRSKSRASH